MFIFGHIYKEDMTHNFMNLNFFCLTISHFIGFAQHEVQPTIFGYIELKATTRDFHPTMYLGEGSFGVVYKVN